MSGKITIIVGLPGAGKSRLIKRLSKRCNGIVADDYLKHVANSPIERTAHFNDSIYYKQLIKDLRKGLSCIISDIVFCDTLVRREVEMILTSDVPDIDISWEFFENSPRKCFANAKRRGRKVLEREKDLIRVLSAKYFVPKGVKAHKVWAPKSVN